VVHREGVRQPAGGHHLLAKEFPFKSFWQRSSLRSMFFTGKIEEFV
jgi:hypothetical protein